MRRLAFLSGRRLMLFVAAVIVALDQVTKEWALSALDHGRTIDLFWTVRLKLVFNRGTAFGLAERFGPGFAILAAVVVVVLIGSARWIERRSTTMIVGAIVGGAVGNVIDRVARDGDGFLQGAVVDFVDLQWWPVFNVADAAIVVGAIGLALASMIVESRSSVGAEPDVAVSEEAGDLDSVSQ